MSTEAFLAALKTAVPDPRCELNYQNPFELLIATQLSAQSTDAMVNKVTPALFARWPDAAALAAAPLPEVEEILRPTGFFRNKAKHAVESAAILLRDHQGEVPKTVEELIRLPGVARKTANVVLGTAFGIPSGITVDTHAHRVSLRWGWHREKQPEKVEKLLMERVPKAEWIDFGHRLVLHGRYTCLARDPQCGTCSLRGLCPVGLGEPDPYRGAGGDVTLDRVTTKDAGSTSIAPSPSPAPTPGRRKAAGRPRKGSAGGKGQP
ncbi:MAG TPA: endonuclease III [Myxococcota bacterium]|nr:endonuclease III [Myxococcota bacterium]